MHDFVTVVSDSLNITASTTSATFALPVAADGNRPRYVRVAATAQAWIKIGTPTVSVTLANGMLTQNADANVLHIPSGVTHIAAITQTGTAIVSISPLENM